MKFENLKEWDKKIDNNLLKNGEQSLFGKQASHFLDCGKVSSYLHDCEYKEQKQENPNG